jgi:hypothetical protein
VVPLLVELFFTLWPSENLTFQISDIARRDRDHPTVFSRIAQKVEIILSPVMLVERDFSVSICTGRTDAARG